MGIVSRASLEKLRDTLSTTRGLRVQGITIKAYDEDQLRSMARILDESGCVYAVLDAPANRDDLYEEYAGVTPTEDPSDLPQYMMVVSGSLDELRAAVRLMEAAVGE